MRILISNKFYYRRGGDCVYSINLENLLKTKNNEVAFFSMSHPLNIETKWNKYFPDEVGFSLGLSSFEAFLRPFGTNEVKLKFNRILDEFQPDIVHLNNIHSQISPLIADIANKRGIKVIWTLHDYKLLCPRYDCLQKGQTICEECFYDKSHVIKHKCMKNSFLASCMAYGESLKWNREVLERITDMFICPSKFMYNKMVQGGFSPSKLVHLCNFIDFNNFGMEYSKNNYYCYIGRLSSEKGVKTLVMAAKKLPYKLKIIGDGPLSNYLKNEVSMCDNIELLGFRQWDEIKQLLSGARFSVIPSEWYENNPLSVIEALSLGTPVLGANIGGIPELINQGINGMLFESKNIDDLAMKIHLMYTSTFNYKSISEISTSRFSADAYYDALETIYKK